MIITMASHLACDHVMIGYVWYVATPSGFVSSTENQGRSVMYDSDDDTELCWDHKDQLVSPE